MPHVPAHRWAELAAGELSAARRRRAERHATRCRRCAAERARVDEARSAMSRLSEDGVPELNWDEVWARVYWQSSVERRTGERPAVRGRRRRWLVVAAPAALAAAGLVTWQLADALRGHERAAEAPAAMRAPSAPPAPAASEPQPTEPLRGVVTFAQGDVQVSGSPVDIDAPITAGAALGTRDGRLTVQLGDATGFTLGPGSSARLRAFDSGDVEIAVDGTISLEVSERAEGQRFAVVAGDRRVLVRGTAFRVDHHDGALDVACSHGRVVVAEADETRTVDAGYRLRVDATEDLRAAALEALSGAQRHVMQGQAVMPLLPAWSGDGALRETSATLSVRGDRDRPVVVDGVEIGRGAFQMRVMSGRHRISAAGAEDDGRWVDTRPGEGGAAIVDVSAEPEPPAPSASGGVPTRRKQLREALAGRLRGCMRPLEKQGLVEGSHIVLDIGVAASGAIGHLNIGDTNLPTSVARCVREVVDDVEFPRGPEAAFRHRLEF